MHSVTYQNGRKVLVRVIPEPGAELDLGFYGTGVATCGPKDHFDLEIGRQIAAGRAIVDFGYQVEQAAEANVITEERWFELVKEMIEQHFAENAQQAEPETEAETVEDALNRGDEVIADGPARIVVDENRYAQLKAEHDAAMAADQPLAIQSFDLPGFENKLDDWSRAYNQVFSELSSKGVTRKRAALEAADAATAIALS